ncbi:hypothetical protein [Dinghuibacter silviterrae]|uniref:Uncharacterized protein n=1 Tax=Dinghuibacter silviterrae TaxID=1539049 RepID=A0A4R8DSK1_9BACT|nr:hypothetical protein [Dinghuibacter silviterrae]TDX00367.1 hypothetical protein EDB95_1389 [Dinghuibacter silviterrae]
MRYISPSQLTQEALSAPYDRKVLQREKKKLLAELELSEEEGLTIKGRHFSRNDILAYFDELENPAVADYHAAVEADPPLLAFLQGEGLEIRFASNPLYDDPAFVAWLSPFYFTSFIDFAADCFQHWNEYGMYTLMATPPLMTREDQDRAYRRIAAGLYKNIELFRRYHGNAGKSTGPRLPFDQVTPFLGHAYVQVIRALPDDHFAQVKDEYAFAMQHPAIAMFNQQTSNRSVAEAWVQDAHELAVSSHIRAQVAAKLAELQKLQRKRTYRLSFFALWVVIVIIRALAYTTGTDTSPKYAPSEEIHVDTAVMNAVLKKPPFIVKHDSTPPDTLLYKAHTPR